MSTSRVLTITACLSGRCCASSGGAEAFFRTKATGMLDGYTSQRCVVTGATGLIGRALLTELASDWEVHGISRKVPERDGTRTRWHAMDLSEAGDMSGLPGSVNAIVYLAQSDRFRDFPASARDVFAVN